MKHLIWHIYLEYLKKAKTAWLDKNDEEKELFMNQANFYLLIYKSL